MKSGLLLLCLLGSVLAFPNPQDEVSADDVFGERNAGSYGTDSGGVDPDVIDELFGIDDTEKNDDQQQPYQEDDSQSSHVDDDPYEGDDDDDDDVSSDLVEDYKPPKSDNQKIDERSRNCSFYSEDGYQCVPYYSCDEFGEIITDGGPGLIDIRGNFGVEILIDPENSKCLGYLEVCCRHPDYAFDPIKPKPKPYVSRCGNRNHNGIGVRITNADQIEASTQFGEWPHMCAVLENKDDKNLYVCGASLIAPGIVMTAAHCVDKFAKRQNRRQNRLKVRCGEWDTQKTIEPAPHQDRDVRYINVHPLFSSRNLTNNVALLHMEVEFDISSHIDTICLPNLDDLEQSYDWEHCFATGWGKDDFGSEGKYQVIMKQVELNLVSPYDCQEALRGTRLGSNFNLDSTALCAGGVGGVDTCKGDGGGPLVCPVKGSSGIIERSETPGGSGSYDGDNNEPAPIVDVQYVQAGIVGWGVGCGEEGVPGVYTDVADMLCFIEWATKCVEGDDAYDYGMSGRCDNWADNQLGRLQDAIDAYQYQVDYAPNDRIAKRIERRLDQHKKAYQKVERLANRCGKFASDDLTDDDDLTDLSGYTRTGAEVDEDGQK